MLNLLPASLSLFALSAGIVHQAGTNVRVSLSHNGAPLEVRMVAVDRQYNDVEGTQSFPEVARATRKPRKVSVRVPSGAWAICARTVKPVGFNGQIGSGVHFESCAELDPDQLQGRRFGFGSFGSSNGLRNALQDVKIEINN